MRIKDHREAIEEFKALEVSISELAIHPEGAARDQEWRALQPLEHQIDLARYVDGQYLVLAREPVSAGSYDGIRLTVERARGILKTGEQVEVAASMSPVALSFTVTAEQTTVVLLDLVVVDLSDEPGGGYELYIKEVSVVK